MPDSGSIVKLGLLAGGAYAYLLWQRLQPSSTTAAPTAAPVGPAFNSLDQIYQRLVGAVAAGLPGYKANPSGYRDSPYNYLYYLNQVTEASTTALDFSVLFPDQVQGSGQLVPNATGLTLAQWWSKVAPVMQSSQGLSGPGVFGGLAGLAGRRR